MAVLESSRVREGRTCLRQRTTAPESLRGDRDGPSSRPTCCRPPTPQRGSSGWRWPIPGDTDVPSLRHLLHEIASSPSLLLADERIGVAGRTLEETGSKYVEERRGALQGSTAPVDKRQQITE